MKIQDDGFKFFVMILAIIAVLCFGFLAFDKLVIDKIIKYNESRVVHIPDAGVVDTSESLSILAVTGTLGVLAVTGNTYGIKWNSESRKITGVLDYKTPWRKETYNAHAFLRRSLGSWTCWLQPIR